MVLFVAFEQFVSFYGFVELWYLFLRHDESHEVELPGVDYILYFLFVVVGEEWSIQNNTIFPLVVNGHEDVVVHLG